MCLESARCETSDAPQEGGMAGTDLSSVTATWQALLSVMLPLILMAAFNETFLFPFNR